MSRRYFDPLQPNLDFFDTIEEKQVVEHNKIIEIVIDDLLESPTAELMEIPVILNPYKPVIVNNNINDTNFSASQWINDNLTAIEIANKYDKIHNITHEEKQLLMRYHGWGGLSEVFDERRHTNGQFAHARTRLKNLLSEEEYRQARSSTLTSMYTPMDAVKILQNGLTKLGAFNPKREVSVLDPASGTGRMIYSLNNIKPYLIELDPITAKISAAIFGKDYIQNCGFEKSNVLNNVFDVGSV